MEIFEVILLGRSSKIAAPRGKINLRCELSEMQ